MKKKESINYQDWLKKASHDLETAGDLLSREGYPEIIAFHCQQTVEKSLKAYLLFTQKSFPKTHNLVFLLNLCKKIDKQFEKFKNICAELEPLYIVDRYPFDDEDDYNNEELADYIKYAKKIWNFIIAKIRVK